MKNIKTIQIQNFRGIDSLEISDCNRVNVFIGKNNVGKSSILEAIFLATGMSNSQLPLSINMFRGVMPQDISNLKYLFYNMETTLHPEMKLEFSNGYERGLTLSPLTQTISDLATSAKTINSGALQSMIGLLLDFYEKYPEKETDHYQSKLDFLANGTIVPSIDNKYFEEINATYLHSDNSKTNYIDPISKIVKEKKSENLLNLITKFDSDIESFNLLPDGLYLGKKGLDKLMLCNVAGDGLKKFITIVAIIIANQNSVVLIDEIENGIHYSSYPILWKTLFESAQKSENQLFITTHSWEELVALQNVLQENTEFQKEIAVFMIRKTTKRGLQSYRIDYEGLNDSIKNENEIR